MSTPSESSCKGVVVYTGDQPKKHPPFRAETRLNVTVKMIMDAAAQPKDQGRFVINKSQVYTVQLCGMLTDITHGDDWTDFVLYDGTGMIKGRIWSRDPEGWTDLSAAINMSYYMINATVSTATPEPRFGALTAREITDHNKITVHFLTAIHEHLYLEERYSKLDLHTADFARARVEIDKESILSILSSDKYRENEAGASGEDLCRALDLDPQKIREALEELLNVGAIYNTTSDHHYKLADN